MSGFERGSKLQDEGKPLSYYWMVGMEIVLPGLHSRYDVRHFSCYYWKSYETVHLLMLRHLDRFSVKSHCIDGKSFDGIEVDLFIDQARREFIRFAEGVW